MNPSREPVPRMSRLTVADSALVVDIACWDPAVDWTDSRVSSPIEPTVGPIVPVPPHAVGVAPHGERRAVLEQRDDFVAAHVCADAGIA